MGQRFSSFWKSALARVPLLGRLNEVPRDALSEASAEVWWATFFATMPFWMPPMLGYVFFREPTTIWSGIKDGDLLIYASALVGPLVYIIGKRYGTFRVPFGDENEEKRKLSYQFPFARISMALSMIICALSAIVFTIKKFTSLLKIANEDLINQSGVAWISILIFFIGTVLLFCVTSYRNMLEKLGEEHSDQISNALPTQEREIAAQWMDRRPN